MKSIAFFYPQTNHDVAFNNRYLIPQIAYYFPIEAYFKLITIY